MKDREMGDLFQICVLFQAITVLYAASISHPLGRPPNISHPLGRPPNISHPLGRPPNISHPLGRPPNISHPLGRPPNISHPSRRPPSISHPLEIPPNISHPLRRPPNISHPSEIPPNISHPLRRPLNISHPSRRPPNISNPLWRPPNISHPSRRPPNHQLLEDSMKLFNEGLNNSSFLYKLLEVNSHRQADSHENNSLSFVIKETVCRKPAEIPEECPFKEGGVMKNCTAVYSGPGQDKAELRCQTLDPPADSHDNNSLSFVIKETVCRKSEEIPGECPFKEGGVMKNCTAVYSEPGRDKAELSCQTLDPPTHVPSLPPTTSEGADEDRSGQSHHKAAQFINSGKKNEATFLDVIGRPLPGSHLSASCLKCIFDDLPKTHK